MRLVSVLPVGWLMLAGGISAAALPINDAALSERSAAADIGSVRNAFDDALSKAFNQDEKEKIKAALRAGVDRLADDDRHPKKGLDNGLGEILNSTEVEKVDGALDVAIGKAKDIISRSLAEEPSISERDVPFPDNQPISDVSEDKHPASVVSEDKRPVNPKESYQRPCDCQSPLDRIRFVNDLDANKTDSHTVICFKYCVTRTDVVLTEIPKNNFQRFQLKNLIKSLEKLLKNPKAHKPELVDIPAPTHGQPVQGDKKDVEHPPQQKSDHTPPAPISKRNDPADKEEVDLFDTFRNPASFNSTVRLGERICDCRDIGRELANQLKVKSTPWNNFKFFFWRRRHNPCFVACVGKARNWVQKHNESMNAAEHRKDIHPAGRGGPNEDFRPTVDLPSEPKKTPKADIPSLRKRKFSKPHSLPPLDRPLPEEGQEEYAEHELPQPLPLPELPPGHLGIDKDENFNYWVKTYKRRFDETGLEDDCNRVYWILQRYKVHSEDFHDLSFVSWRVDHKALIVSCAVEKQLPGAHRPPPSRPEWVPDLNDLDTNDDVTVNPKYNPLVDGSHEPKQPKEPHKYEKPDYLQEFRAQERKRFRAWAENYGRTLVCAELWDINEQWKNVSKSDNKLAKTYYRTFRFRNQEGFKRCKNKSNADLWGDVEEEWDA